MVAVGTLMMIMVLVGIAVAAWLSSEKCSWAARVAAVPDQRRDILNERYARGEIDTDDYEHRLSKLR